MPEFETTVEFEVYCSCGEGLCQNSTTGEKYNRTPALWVEPCPKCMQAEYDRGHDVGYEKAMAENENEDD